MTTVTSSSAGSPPTGRRAGRDRRATPLIGLLPLVVCLAAWQVFGAADNPYFPPPSRWFSSLEPLVSGGQLFTALLATAVTFALSLVVATVGGAVLGAVIGARRRTDRAMGPLLEFLRALPASSLVPIATLVLGYTGGMKLAVVCLPATWPILLACRSARRSLSPVLLEVPRTLGLSRSETFRKVLVPALLPSVLLGVRLAAPLALIITLLVEIVTRVNGIGALLADAQANFASAQVYAMLAIAGLLGLAVNWLVVRAEGAVSFRMRGPAQR